MIDCSNLLRLFHYPHKLSITLLSIHVALKPIRNRLENGKMREENSTNTGNSKTKRALRCSEGRHISDLGLETLSS